MTVTATITVTIKATTTVTIIAATTVPIVTITVVITMAITAVTAAVMSSAHTSLCFPCPERRRRRAPVDQGCGPNRALRAVPGKYWRGPGG